MLREEVRQLSTRRHVLIDMFLDEHRDERRIDGAASTTTWRYTVEYGVKRIGMIHTSSHRWERLSINPGPTRYIPHFIPADWLQWSCKEVHRVLKSTLAGEAGRRRGYGRVGSWVRLVGTNGMRRGDGWVSPPAVAVLEIDLFGMGKEICEMNSPVFAVKNKMSIRKELRKISGRMILLHATRSTGSPPHAEEQAWKVIIRIDPNSSHS